MYLYHYIYITIYIYIDVSAYHPRDMVIPPKASTSNLVNRRAPARLRQPEPRMRLAVRGVPKGAPRTHSA